MASALIDAGAIHRMVLARLETLIGGKLTIIQLGEGEPPEPVDAWVRHESIDLKFMQRHRGTAEPDLADLSLVFGVFVSEGQSSKLAIGTAASLLRAAFEGETIVDPASPAAVVHQIDLTESIVAIVSEPMDERRIRVATVTITGVAQRWSGVSVEDHLN